MTLARFLVIFALACCAIGPMQAQDEDYASYNYGLLTKDEAGQPQLLLIDPLHPTTDLSTFTKDPFPAGPRMLSLPGSYYDMKPELFSPYGHWFVNTRLDDVTGDHVFEVWEVGGTDWFEGLYNNGSDETSILEIAWSPDSTAVAYTFFYPTWADGHLELQVHSLEDGETSILFEGKANARQPHHLSWSADSQQLAFVRWDCRESSCPNNDIFQVYSMADKTMTTSIQTEKSIASPTCNNAWSPDNRYIAFESGCDSFPRPYSEVYLWDTQLNEFWQVTHLANPFPPTDETRAEDLVPYMNSYSLLWTDPETLLISYRQLAGIGQFRMDHFEVKTILYHTEDRTSTPISDDSFTPIPSPIDDRFAYISSTSTLVPLDGDPSTGELAQTQDAVKIARFEGTTRLNLYTGPYGGYPLWSQDGRFLAYAIDDDASDGYNIITGYIFIDTKTNTQRQLSFEPYQYEPMGWFEGPGLG